MNKVILIFLVCLLGASFAQAQTSKAFFESVIKNEDTRARAPVALPHLEPQDVVWSKTVWRELVLREKMNLPLYYPSEPMDGRMSLIDVLMTGIEKSLKLLTKRMNA